MAIRTRYFKSKEESGERGVSRFSGPEVSAGLHASGAGLNATPLALYLPTRNGKMKKIGEQEQKKWSTGTGAGLVTRSAAMLAGGARPPAAKGSNWADS